MKKNLQVFLLKNYIIAIGKIILKIILKKEKKLYKKK